MSSVPFITVMQPSPSVTRGKSAAQQTVATAQPQPNASSSVTISSSGTASSYYGQQMAEITAGYAQARVDNVSSSNLSSPAAARDAYNYAHQNPTAEPIGGLVNISAGPNAPITYTSGAPVTVASQAYYTQQATSYQNQVLQLYNSEVSKGTPPGEIINKFMDLQAQQPEAFRAMMMWPPAADPTSIQTATNTSGTPPQYLNAGGQIVKL